MSKSITDKDGFIQITIPPGAYEFESLNKEIERIVIKEGYFTEVDHPFTNKPNFSTLGSIIETSRQGPLNTFVPDDSIRDFQVLMQAQYVKKITCRLIHSTYFLLIKLSTKQISLKDCFQK